MRTIRSYKKNLGDFRGSVYFFLLACNVILVNNFDTCGHSVPAT